MIKNFEQFMNESEKREMTLPSDVLRISDLYSKAGKKLYVVGGAVRDFLQNKKPKDFDLATDANPDETLQILKGHFRTKEVGKAFGVVIAITADGEYEIATFREDLSGGRRPDAVKFTSIDKDVLRRDLTINALFYDIESGEVVDLVGGIEDLKNKNVRTVGKPEERFDEDALRKLRAVRFAIRLDGKLDAETYNALKRNPELVSRGIAISGERVRDEFFVKTLGSAKNIQHAISLLDELGFFPHIFPGLKILTDKVIEGSPLGTLALMLRENDPSKLKKSLVETHKYEAPEASAISFLIRLQSLTPENAFDMKRMQDRSSLRNDRETVLSFAMTCLPLKLAQTFADYEITTDGTELEEKGFKGQLLGQEMQRIETEKFKSLLK